MSNEMFDGFQLLQDELSEIIKKVEEPVKILEVGVKEFVTDLLKLPKPISDIRKSGYTHLIHTFTYRIKKNEIDVGWGKYYGPMVENGTMKMDARKHMNPLWDRNKEKYYKTMLTKLGI